VAAVAVPVAAAAAARLQSVPSLRTPRAPDALAGPAAF
jgi:hypothetical protein